MSLHVVTAVEALPDFCARIIFADGYCRELDLRPALRGPAFEALLEVEVFRQMVIDFDTLSWPNGADISPETLRFWCERGRVTPVEEREAHFSGIAVARVAEE